MIKKLLCLLVLLLTATTGAMAQDYYAPSTDEVIILKDVYNASNSGYSSHSAIAWGGSASTSNKKAGDPNNNGGLSTSSTVSCYSVKGTGQGKNITLSITGVSTVIVYHEKKTGRYIELRDGSKGGNIIGSGESSTYCTEVALTATNKYSIFLHGTSNGSDDQDFYVYAIKLIAAPAAPATTGYSVTLADGTEDADKWTVKVGEGQAQALPLEGVAAGTAVTATYSGEKKVKSVKAVKKAAKSAEGHALSASAVGEIVGSDGKAYAVEDKDDLPSGVTAVAMVAYKSGSNGLAIQLNGNPVSMKWAQAKTYAEGLTAVSGGTWRLPSKADWQNMFVGCAVSGDATVPDADSEMDPIAGFQAKIAAAGITWKSGDYWTSTGDDSIAWMVGVNPEGSYASASFGEIPSSFAALNVLGCLAF